MLFLLILTLCYSVSSFDFQKTLNDYKDGNLMKGLFDGFMEINKNGDEIVENLEKFEKNLKLNGLSEKNSLADLGLGRMADVPSRTKRAVPNSAPIHRFCQRIDLDCCCNNCGNAGCDSNLPESFDWSQHVAMPKNNRNSSDDLVAGVIADYIELLYTLKYNQRVELAAEQLTDCAEDWEKEVFVPWAGAVSRLVIQGGFELASVYESDTSDSTCRFDEDKITVHVGLCYQFNVERENCLRRVLMNAGPVLVGLRKANWDYIDPIMTDCDAVVDTYTPFILVGFGQEFYMDVWFLRSPEGEIFSIPRGIACQDIGMYTLFVPVK